MISMIHTSFQYWLGIIETVVQHIWKLTGQGRFVYGKETTLWYFLVEIFLVLPTTDAALLHIKLCGKVMLVLYGPSLFFTIMTLQISMNVTDQTANQSDYNTKFISTTQMKPFDLIFTAYT